MQLPIQTYSFCLGDVQYRSVRTRGWLFLVLFLLVALLCLALGGLLWRSYAHTFTPYLKWQDALVALLWFIAFVAFGGSTFVIRFLCALHAGFRRGMVSLTNDNILSVRDLSHENLISIFWMMNSAFWCFVVTLLGLLPCILIEWTLRLPSPALSVLATALAIVLSLAGLVVSIASALCVFIGCVGALSFCRKLGSSHIYTLNSELTLRIDNFVLTIICPGTTESMIELDLLSAEDQRSLLSLLYRRWKDEQEAWNPGFGDEIALALEHAQHAPLPV